MKLKFWKKDPIRESQPKRDLLPPRFMFMEVNKRCNLKCTHCDFWQRNDDDRENYLSRERKQELITEFAAMSPHGSLVICGGEPMLDLEEYFYLCTTARNSGLRVLSVVNGTRIRNAAMADRMVAEGPHEISISLNSHDPKIHNATRGVHTAFDKATSALRLLTEARDRNPEAKSRIIVMGLIFASNYKFIDQFYDFVLNDLNCDNLKLNFVQPTFGQAGRVDPFFAKEGNIDPVEVSSIIEACDQKYNLGLNPVWKQKVGMYIDSLQDTHDRERGWSSRSGTKEFLCNSFERNLMIDHYGYARLCFSGAFEGAQMSRPGDLETFWYGAEAIRQKMRMCKHYCGISHSVRAESSTIAGNAKRETFRAANEDRVIAAE